MKKRRPGTTATSPEATVDDMRAYIASHRHRPEPAPTAHSVLSTPPPRTSPPPFEQSGIHCAEATRSGQIGSSRASASGTRRMLPPVQTNAMPQGRVANTTTTTMSIWEKSGAALDQPSPLRQQLPSDLPSRTAAREHATFAQSHTRNGLDITAQLDAAHAHRGRWTTRRAQYRDAAVALDEVSHRHGSSMPFHLWAAAMLDGLRDHLQRLDGYSQQAAVLEATADMAASQRVRSGHAGPRHARIHIDAEHVDVYQRPHPLRSAVAVSLLQRLFLAHALPTELWRDVLALIFDNHCANEVLQRHFEDTNSIAGYLDREFACEKVKSLEAERLDLAALHHTAVGQLHRLRTVATDEAYVSDKARLRMTFTAWRGLKYNNAWRRVAFQVRFEQRSTLWLRRCFDAWKSYVTIEQLHHEVSDERRHARDIVRTCEQQIQEGQNALRQQLLSERDEHLRQVEDLKGRKTLSEDVIKELEALKEAVSNGKQEQRSLERQIKELTKVATEQALQLRIADETSNRALHALRRTALIVIGPRTMDAIKASDVIVNARGIGTSTQYRFTSDDGVDCLQTEALPPVGVVAANIHGTPPLPLTVFARPPPSPQLTAASTGGAAAHNAAMDVVSAGTATLYTGLHLSSILCSWANGVIQRDSEQQLQRDMERDGRRALTGRRKSVAAGKASLFPGIVHVCTSFADGKHYVRLISVIFGHDSTFSRRLKELVAVAEQSEGASFQLPDAKAVRSSVFGAADAGDTTSEPENIATSIFTTILNEFDSVVKAHINTVLQERLKEAVRLLTEPPAVFAHQDDPFKASLLALGVIGDKVRLPDSAVYASGNLLESAFSGFNDFYSGSSSESTAARPGMGVGDLHFRLGDAPFRVEDFIEANRPLHAAAHHFLLITLLKCYAAMKVIPLPQWEDTQLHAKAIDPAEIAPPAPTSASAPADGTLRSDSPLSLAGTVNGGDPNAPPAPQIGNADGAAPDDASPAPQQRELSPAERSARITTQADALAVCISLAQASIGSWSVLVQYVQEAFFFSFKTTLCLVSHAVMADGQNTQGGAGKRRATGVQGSGRKQGSSVSLDVSATASEDGDHDSDDDDESAEAASVWEHAVRAFARQWVPRQTDAEVAEQLTARSMALPTVARFCFNPLRVMAHLHQGQIPVGGGTSAATAGLRSLQAAVEAMSADDARSASAAASADPFLAIHDAALPNLVEQLFTVGGGSGLGAMRANATAGGPQQQAALLEQFLLFDLPVCAGMLNAVFTFAATSGLLSYHQRRPDPYGEPDPAAVVSHRQWVVLLQLLNYCELAAGPNADDIRASRAATNAAATRQTLEGLSRRYAAYAPKEGLTPTEFALCIGHVAYRFWRELQAQGGGPAMTPLASSRNRSSIFALRKTSSLRRRTLGGGSSTTSSAVAKNSTATTHAGGNPRVPAPHELPLFTLLAVHVLPRIPAPLFDARVALRGALAAEASSGPLSSASRRLFAAGLGAHVPAPPLPIGAAVDHFKRSVMTLYSQSVIEAVACVAAAAKAATASSPAGGAKGRKDRAAKVAVTLPPAQRDEDLAAVVEELMGPFGAWAVGCKGRAGTRAAVSPGASPVASGGADPSKLSSGNDEKFYDSDVWFVTVASQTRKNNKTGADLTEVRGFLETAPAGVFGGVGHAVAAFAAFLKAEAARRAAFASSAASSSSPIGAKAAAASPELVGEDPARLDAILQTLRRPDLLRDIVASVSTSMLSRFRPFDPRVRETLRPPAHLTPAAAMSASALEAAAAKTKLHEEQALLVFGRREAHQADCFADMCLLLAAAIWPAPTFTDHARLTLFSRAFLGRN